MSETIDPVTATVTRYFLNEGEFVRYKNQDQQQKFRTLFEPFLDSLCGADQSRAVALVGEIAIANGIGADRICQSEAQDALFYMTFPWPVDRRRMLVAAKEPLMRAFTSPQNLARWCDYDEARDNDGYGWVYGPADALFLYRVSLIVATDEELQAPFEHLVNHALSKGFRIHLLQVRRRAEGIRLCSPRQHTHEEYVAHKLRVQRERVDPRD